MTGNGRRVVIGASSVPRFLPHVRFQHDPVRDRWIVLAPERMFVPDDIAAEILQRVDGARTVATLAGDLAQDFDAPAATVTLDIITLLQDLADKMVITA
ncbi:MAG: pyrroloquinoline quinone biosynthesis peptide chaperone PqqD [Azospirillaceae bacterium]|nr:pyrroloquinoline quinone biosynthesis peptide chaperone PqqD [Azospirillaceae bacterium]